MHTSDNTDKLIPALIQASREFKTPHLDVQGQYMGRRYASLNAVLDAIIPALRKHDLFVMQQPGLITIEQEGKGIATRVSVKTRLWHASGQWLEIENLTIPQPHPKWQIITDQSIGASITYNRRYSLKCLFNLGDTESEVDGEVVYEASPTITDEQVGHLDQLMAESGADYQKFIQFFGIDALTELPNEKFGTAEAMLLKKKERASDGDKNA